MHQGFNSLLGMYQASDACGYATSKLALAHLASRDWEVSPNRFARRQPQTSIVLCSKLILDLQQALTTLPDHTVMMSNEF
jgi:hypothetical protein